MIVIKLALVVVLIWLLYRVVPIFNDFFLYLKYRR